MALNSLIARCQSATRRLMDSADWTHDGSTVALQGLFDSRLDSRLDGRAKPVAPAFIILSADADGIAVGDTLTLEGQTYDITGATADRLGETVLDLRIAR